MSKFFYGNEISEYGKECGYVDYSTLAKSFDSVLNNDIMKKTSEIGCWEQVNGEETDLYEIAQWYIISDEGAFILRKHTNEVVHYNEEIDMYLWGVTHYGTAWSYVATEIKIA